MSAEMRVDPELAANPNYRAYKDIEEMLKQSYLGQWVAFADGEMILCEPDKESLFREIAKNYEDKAIFVKEILEKGRTYDIGGRL